jgi:hypothetical protein
VTSSTRPAGHVRRAHLRLAPGLRAAALQLLALATATPALAHSVNPPPPAQSGEGQPPSPAWSPVGPPAVVRAEAAPPQADAAVRRAEHDRAERELVERELAEHEEWPHFGLLRSRDLTPFGFLRLDMRPAHAYVARAGSWAVGLDLGYQNTWAIGGAAEGYLKSLSGRRELGPADWRAIVAGGEAYIVDLELAQLDATVSHWFSDRLSAYLIVSGVRYQGGFLDRTIERFHETAGFSDFERDVVKRNDVNVLVNLRRGGAEFYEAPVDSGVLDPTVGLRYTLARVPDPWNVIVEIAAKLPLQDRRRPFLSTGVTDWGTQLTLEYARRRNAFYASGAVVRTGGGTPVESSRRWLPSAVLGYERSLSRHASLILQVQAARSPYDERDTALEELLRDKFQAALGLRWRATRAIWSIAVTENLQNLNNTPDVGLQFGFALTPDRR